MRVHSLTEVIADLGIGIGVVERKAAGVERRGIADARAAEIETGDEVLVRRVKRIQIDAGFRASPITRTWLCSVVLGIVALIDRNLIHRSGADGGGGIEHIVIAGDAVLEIVERNIGGSPNAIGSGFVVRGFEEAAIKVPHGVRIVVGADEIFAAGVLGGDLRDIVIAGMRRIDGIWQGEKIQ